MSPVTHFAFSVYCTIAMFTNTYFHHKRSRRMISECLDWKNSVLTWKQLLVGNQAAYTPHLPPACSNLCLPHGSIHRTVHHDTQLLVSFQIDSRPVAEVICLHNLQKCKRKKIGPYIIGSIEGQIKIRSRSRR